MTLSLGEVEALAKTAARGAGYPWGLAEEAGQAVRWLCGQGLDGCAALAALLAAIDGADLAQLRPVPGTVWQGRAGALCPITAGAALSDYAVRLKDEGITLHDVIQPVLLLPFAGHAARALQAQVVVDWASGMAVTEGNGLCLSGQPPLGAMTVTVTLGEAASGALCSRQSRANPDPAALAQLKSIAQRTYAPATEASRRLGAGSGSPDND